MEDKRSSVGQDLNLFTSDKIRNGLYKKIKKINTPPTITINLVYAVEMKIQDNIKSQIGERITANYSSISPHDSTILKIKNRIQNFYHI